jgi:hypothetical protein
VELNFDFHPAWMSEQFAATGLTVTEQYGVSHFRLPVAKERIGAATLARVDAALFGLGGKYPLAPSVFVQATAPAAGVRARASTAPEDVAALFRCPKSGAESMEQIDEGLVRSPASGLTYARRDGVWDFKEPVE